MDTKVCPRCKTEKDSQAEFYRSSSTNDSCSIYCKDCELRKTQTIKGKQQRRNINLKARFGITTEDYNKMFEDQDGRCLICRNPQKHLLYNSLCVDHDHTSGKVRGLLCHSCNTKLGWFEANKNNVLDYLS